MTSFIRGPVFAGFCGAVGAVLISGLSAFAMRKLGAEMSWLGVLSGGAAGGVVGHGVLRVVLLFLDRWTSWARTPMDRFVWLILTGFVASLILGAALMAVLFALPGEPDGVATASRTLGARVFPVIGWLVGILASSLPLALSELQGSDRLEAP